VALFKSDPSIAFPGSELTSLIRNDAGQFTLTTKFLGFSGSQSPLPGYYLDRMAQESAQNEEGLAAFLDLFSHRWTQFAYHAWRKYRYYICFRNGGTDGFSQRMYALVGLGNKSARCHQPQQNAGLRGNTGNAGPLA
jgi:type VI secretion system protein ImpH